MNITLCSPETVHKHLTSLIPFITLNCDPEMFSPQLQEELRTLWLIASEAARQIESSKPKDA